MKSSVDKIRIKMYRIGTGDCFFLQFLKKKTVSFKMMIDCGCINAKKSTFNPIFEDLIKITGDDNVIDLLVVTHEHSDHINGFEKCADLFDKFIFKNVWFAWTESKTDELANYLREFHSKLALALNIVTNKFDKLIKNEYYSKLHEPEIDGKTISLAKEHFIQSLISLNYLNRHTGFGVGKPLPTMVELLENYNIIKKKNKTKVECLNPGDVMYDLPGAEGIRFYILGPPHDAKLMSRTEIKGETYEKRESKSIIDFSFLSALGVTERNGFSPVLAFEPEYESGEDSEEIKRKYQKEEKWRRIDHDWLFSAGSIAMRYESSINNTSMVLAIQFEQSEKVLLFTGDAEYGNWEGWHKNLDWPVKKDGKIVRKRADYFLENTVFYKVGHHLSQNGTAKGKGIDMMNSTDLTAMASLNFEKILTGWLKTMPNDLLGAELIRKTKGKLYLAGDHKKILKNIRTDRVTISKEHEETLNRLNKKFDGKKYMECDIEG